MGRSPILTVLCSRHFPNCENFYIRKALGPDVMYMGWTYIRGSGGPVLGRGFDWAEPGVVLYLVPGVGDCSHERLLRDVWKSSRRVG